MTRAKFVCQSVTDNGDTKSVVLTPVTNGSDEDKSFWKWTPSGRIEMQVLNPDVKFEPKKTYYVDFTEAES